MANSKNENKKNIERVYATKAVELLNVNWMLVDIPEPLDFEVQNGGEKFGLEVMQIFADGEKSNSGGSLLRKNESANIKKINKLAKKYYEIGGHPILLKVLGDFPLTEIDTIAVLLLENSPKEEWEKVNLCINKSKFFIKKLPVNFRDYSRWHFLSDKIGFVHEIIIDDLQSAINKKLDKIYLYKEKYENIELLLVADPFLNSGKLYNKNAISNINIFGFRKVYLLYYPNYIQTIL